MRITGWVWFAGILLIVGGCFNIIHGFAALERKEYFTSDIVYSNLTFWGWAFILWGLAQLYAGVASGPGASRATRSASSWPGPGRSCGSS